MVKQNDIRLMRCINEIGCFVRSCGAVAEIKAGRELTPEQINDLWIWGKMSGNIDYKDNVKHSAPLITRAFETLGGSGKFVEVATFKDGRMNYYESVGDELRRAPKSYIQKVTTDGRIGTHFRVIDHAGVLLFDPYEPEVKPIKVLYSIVYAFKEAI